MDSVKRITVFGLNSRLGIGDKFHDANLTCLGANQCQSIRYTFQAVCLLDILANQPCSMLESHWLSTFGFSMSSPISPFSLSVFSTSLGTSKPFTVLRPCVSHTSSLATGLRIFGSIRLLPSLMASSQTDTLDNRKYSSFLPDVARLSNSFLSTSFL